MTTPPDGSKAPLTESELVAIRKVILQEARRAWLFGSIRASASWIVITLGAIALSYDSVVKAIKSMVGSE
jgi:hypothetical protein